MRGINLQPIKTLIQKSRREELSELILYPATYHTTTTTCNEREDSGSSPLSGMSRRGKKKYDWVPKDCSSPCTVSPSLVGQAPPVDDPWKMFTRRFSLSNSKRKINKRMRGRCMIARYCIYIIYSSYAIPLRDCPIGWDPNVLQECPSLEAAMPPCLSHLATLG